MRERKEEPARREEVDLTVYVIVQVKMTER
jgi:hypothetical protein